jgi:hypothetical protein
MKVPQGLDFETWEGKNASVARDHFPEAAHCSPICLGMILDCRQQPKRNLSSTASW